MARCFAQILCEKLSLETKAFARQLETGAREWNWRMELETEDLAGASKMLRHGELVLS